MAVDVVDLFMALLSFVESAPRAYRLKASNAAPPFSTSAGTSAKISAIVSFIMFQSYPLKVSLNSARLIIESPGGCLGLGAIG
jgi:hypothetical protein